MCVGSMTHDKCSQKQLNFIYSIINTMDMRNVGIKEDSVIRPVTNISAPAVSVHIYINHAAIILQAWEQNFTTEGIVI